MCNFALGITCHNVRKERRFVFWIINLKKMATKKEAAIKAAEKMVAEKPAPAKKTTKRAKKDKTVYLNAVFAGFRAGDVYQALVSAEKPLAIKEIAKAADVNEESVLLGLGWLFKEGKLAEAEGNKIQLA